jgi:transcription termination factor Rho
MKEALRKRLHLIQILGTVRHELIREAAQQIQQQQPTKLIEAAGLLKAALQVLGNALDDAEPTPVSLTMPQLQLAEMKNGDAVIRAVRLKETLEKYEAQLMSDHVGNPILSWQDLTPTKQKAALDYLDSARAGVKQAIEDL